MLFNKYHNLSLFIRSYHNLSLLIGSYHNLSFLFNGSHNLSFLFKTLQSLTGKTSLQEMKNKYYILQMEMNCRCEFAIKNGNGFLEIK